MQRQKERQRVSAKYCAQRRVFALAQAEAYATEKQTAGAA